MGAGGRDLITVAMLRDGLSNLPSEQSSAVRVLHVADDPDACAADLADAVILDPVLTAQVMRLANSAYYGLSRRVGSAEMAVSVLGFATIRSLAASCAAGALRGDTWIPAGFWEHAAATAVSSALVGERIGMRRAEAFSLGLLHDLGAALLCRFDPGRYRFVEAADVSDHRSRAGLERTHLGLDHAEVGGIVLEDWHFPPEFCQAIANHHDRLPSSATPAQRALATGQVLAHLAELEDHEGERAAAVVAAYEAEFDAGEVELCAAFEISRTVRCEAKTVASIFSTPPATHVPRSA